MLFFRKAIGSNKSFTLIELQVFKIAKFEFRVTVHYGPIGKMHPVIIP